MLVWIFKMACTHSWIWDSPTISLLFAKTFEETKFLLDKLVTCLAEVRLRLNVGKTQSQSPSEVPLRNGQVIEVLDRGSTHKWLGCMLCTASTGNHAPDLAHHLQAAPKAFFAHRFFLVNRNVAMRDRFKYFDAMVTPVACFSAAHRKVYKQDLCRMDIVFRRLLRSIVGPPGDVDWTLPWHEILHHWNERVKFLTARHGLKTWSVVCLGQYWKFANHVSTLPRERWVVRALNWFPEHARRVGRPAYSWDSMLQSFCRHKQIGNWRHCAHDTAFWMNQFDDFISFTEIWWTWNVDIICRACLRPEGAAYFGMQVSLTHTHPAGPRKLTSGHGATSPPQPRNDVVHCQKFIELHVITNMYEGGPIPFWRFLVEIDTFDFDIFCICETWRGDDDLKLWTTTLGHTTVFSGGSTHWGVTTSIGRESALEMFHVHFHGFSDRVCAPHAAISNMKNQFFFDTFQLFGNKWSGGTRVWLIDCTHICMRGDGATPLLAGDLDAAIRTTLPHEEVECLWFWWIVRMWTPECKGSVFGSFGAWSLRAPKPNGHNHDQRWILSTHDFGAELVWLFYFCWSGPSICSLHRYLHARETSTKFDDETDAQLDAETEQQRPTFRIFRLCGHIAQVGAKSRRHRLGKHICGHSKCCWTLSNTNICNFEFRHFFVNFSHTGAMRHINNVGRNWAFRFGPSIVKKSELGNLKILRSTWQTFRNGNAEML